MNHPASPPLSAAVASAAQTASTNDDFPPGSVCLIGAGPGDPELITVKGLNRLQRAEVVLYDHLVDPAVLALASPSAWRIDVGKEASRHTLPQDEINALLVRQARQGRRVARLKGGDPFLFGRGGEEVQALAEAGIPCEVIPGITAACGAAARGLIPLTHRDYAQGVSFVTGHRRDGEDELEWTRHTGAEETLVIYMGLAEAARICAELMRHGRPGTTPAAVIERATTPQQRIVSADLATLPAHIAAAGVRPPALLIIGEVVRLYPTLNAASVPTATWPA
ncbi:uroporphyrinogen-III C-methyltransferase [Pseudogulbenkiania subflava]|uniref:uroporphyrinogen-III C-methyltransferase n=1 Tax=Pseudogulbenkiania subflava DSM 22618 TaxID=1123014 RepID=A0A1Y6BTD3_9NEIS|nr:uroporphyrinogen-III C-methyltransferase [Pseudogulbenkiania subflava]SMF27224.1 uroporphyrin-III C-methyltransferase [Pseudogulbenkiania subflava DSM 22618]